MIGLRVTGEFHTMDRERMLNDRVNAAIRYDLGNYIDLQAEHFMDEWLLPVASPIWVNQNKTLIQNRMLNSASLLHDTVPWEGANPHDEWIAWSEAAGITTKNRFWEGGNTSICHN